MIRVLLIEDDRGLADSLGAFLRREGFEVSCAHGLGDARRSMAKAPFDVLVLDWMLPDGQGIDLVKDLRKRDDPVRIVLLTARADTVDKVVGLETGANDYLTKPFEPRELVARIRVQVREQRRSGEAAPETHQAGGVRIDPGTREVTFRGRPVPLARMEYELLKLFVENPNKVFSREELLNRVWGFEHYPTTRTVDTHVLQLRQKLDDGLIETLRGVGYRFRAAS